MSWLNLTSYNHPSSNRDSPTTQVWDIRWFAILSAPLLFVTIILPLFIGPVLRSVCHSYVKLWPYWRVILKKLVSCLLIYAYAGWVSSLGPWLSYATAVFSFLWSVERRFLDAHGGIPIFGLSEHSS